MPNFSDFNTRKEAAKTLWGFCHVYLAKGMQLKPAKFHEEMANALGDSNCRMLEVLGFRSSAKSFYGSLALPLWPRSSTRTSILSSSLSAIRLRSRARRSRI